MGDPARPLEVMPAARARPAPQAATALPMPVPRPGRELERGNATLDAVAMRVGSALGIVRQKTRRLRAESALLRKRLTVVRTRAQEEILATAAEWKRTGEQKAAGSRRSALQFADEKPLYVIAGAAAAAFALGFALQIRRSNHARR